MYALALKHSQHAPGMCGAAIRALLPSVLPLVVNQAVLSHTGPLDFASIAYQRSARTGTAAMCWRRAALCLLHTELPLLRLFERNRVMIAVLVASNYSWSLTRPQYCTAPYVCAGVAGQGVVEGRGRVRRKWG
jgi:hypothetical protein